MKTLKYGDKGDDVKLLQSMLNIYADGIFKKLTDEAVREYQKEHNLTVDGIVGPKTWDSLMSSDMCLKKSRRKINEIIIHCTATREGQHVTVETIRKMHIKDRGWSDIGYHYIIYLDGSIHNGRDVDISGAHCSGHNSHSIGVVYVGGVKKDGKTPKDTRTEAQKKSLVKILKALKKLYPNATIHGHYEYSNKACPCFDVKEYKSI